MNAVKGIFDKERFNAFFNPLSQLLDIKNNEIVLKFKEDKTIKVNCINTNGGSNVVTFLEYSDTILEGFEIPENGLEYGIYDLHDFYSLAKLFLDSENTSIEFSETACTMKSQNSEISYFAAQPGIVKEGPEKFKANVEWCCEFTWDNEKMLKLKKALNSVKHPHIVLKGEAGSKTVEFIITNKGLKCSSYKGTIELVDDILCDIDVVFNKDVFIPIISSAEEEVKIQLSNKVMTLITQTKHHKVKNYILATRVG